jgi:hypothetical protein
MRRFYASTQEITGEIETASGVNPLAVLVGEEELALGLAAGCFLDLGLVFAASSGAGSLRGGLLAGGALNLLALDFVGDGGGVCHDECLLSMNLNVWFGAAVG